MTHWIFLLLSSFLLIGGCPLQKNDTSSVDCSLDSLQAQSEVQNELTWLYTAEQSFFSEFAEYNTYYLQAGWEFSEQITSCYNIGFSQPSQLDEFTLARQPSANTGPINTANNSSEFLQLASDYCPNGVCTANSAAFNAIAVGNIDDDSTLDIWLIDEVRNLVHVVDDLAD